MSPIDLPAKTSGWAAASSTVSGSSGHPGVTAEKPAFSKYWAQGSQLLGRSHRPWTKATGVFPDLLASSTCCCSSALIVTAAAGFFFAIKAPLHVGRAVILLDSRGLRLRFRRAEVVFRWACATRVADEGDKRGVDLLGVGPADVVRAALHRDERAVPIVRTSDERISRHHDDPRPGRNVRTERRSRQRSRSGSCE